LYVQTEGAMSEKNEKEDVGDIFEWQDNRRRGNPMPGCDCETCFGMCIIDRYAAIRERWGEVYYQPPQKLGLGGRDD
jgi:hypothetical protein